MHVSHQQGCWPLQALQQLVTTHCQRWAWLAGASQSVTMYGITASRTASLPITASHHHTKEMEVAGVVSQAPEQNYKVHHHTII
jgi:hypothetical protein